MRTLLAAAIVLALALGACVPAREKEPPMDGSTAGANAVTLEDLGIDATEVQHGEARGD